MKPGSNKATAGAPANGHFTAVMEYHDSDSDSQMDLDDHHNSHNQYQYSHKVRPQPNKSAAHSSTSLADKMDTSEDANAVARYGELLTETIQYGQELQGEFSGDPRREVKKALEDTFALIAYPDARRESSLAPLLEPEGRVPVAEELNAAILGTPPPFPLASKETHL